MVFVSVVVLEVVEPMVVLDSGLLHQFQTMSSVFFVMATASNAHQPQADAGVANQHHL